ncbi:non-hydrolyzing UDP-N-acetylglucosamine 2-epimerase [Pseudomonas sp. NPDC087612]|uniref:non-hydrolyzing UDP-N-acetylglucosamine 2-epimerase n=1 Tax=unclassified Pseudomonas TaxID=196821 RepID=UPI0008899615|nr:MULTISPECIES: UDP-N-acetylglucosamine 2-epimerase (non-hydrolyzing) [unclassified Pseudomonas]QPG61701.1 UDP-N-acetylglucosamine 2-epimerase (non-hydrolyzing) [Pseudomonas sp. BIGb0427]UVL58661.1 UDP-N-acetylglucosamine 2-epimerase (non-hydrolyzing) [Pseudomonas sp. B21-035]UVM58296.1 UDP-N-acetylglucosamine 2-epimerase (non-hydrolyzing) [Pseudomonas sp. B21-012]UVM69212.1 UDP-N-acetylglucosamine 2-epimerase (non-hydrolyzing) [Pseudomonas sp. B21-009]SDQ74045.1 UDP-N-Acetylglucosamine 2-epi
MAYTVMMVFGTRPEAIKMAPLAQVLRQWPDIELNICSTGQHREMLQQVLHDFGLSVDEDLKVMTQNQTLNGLSQQLLKQLDDTYARIQPDIVLVHGDTTTSFIAALAAFNRQIPIGHVEAGLRTGNLKAPWPEEANRRLTGVIADLHFPPTTKARDNLLREGVVLEHIEVTGNTVIDALLWMREHLNKSQWKPAPESPLAQLRDDQRLVLITGHRRENFGQGFERICLALAELALRYPHVQFVYPVHLNPQVQKAVYALLSHQPNILLVAPQDYQHFVWLMDRAYLILTDSGGVQEEAPALGKPLLVLRKVTERPSVLEGGTVMLVGTQTERIVKETSRLLDDSEAYQRMSRVFSPYGDGHASERIAERLSRWLEENAAERDEA